MLRLNQNETIPIFISKIGVLNNNNREVGMNGYLSLSPPPPKIKQKRTFMSFTILLSSKSNSTRLFFKYTVLQYNRSSKLENVQKNPKHLLTFELV